ncbi:MAG: KH domain-containing protein [Bacillales bacterium]|nr:KH domain-containing protein [Bacillales bacterium]
MLNKTKLEGKTKEEILNKYLSENNLEEKDIFYTESEIKGGLLKSKKVELEIVSKKDIINFIKEFIENLSKNMGITINSEVRENEGIYNVLLVTDNNPIIIGKDGRTIDAIQLLIRQALTTQVGKNIKVIVDASNYRNNKQRNFEREIKKIAKEVLKTRVEAKLDPMNSYNRRIVHSLLADYENIETESFGETPNRYVVIRYKD